MVSHLRVFLCLIIGFLFTTAHTQDFHYSQFFNSPLNLNPGLTGMYNGDIRIHANAKEQWANVPVGYQSGDIGADLKKWVGEKGNYIGYGILFNYDRAGDLDLGWTGGNAFVSYGYRINANNLISPGVTIGYYSRGFNNANAITGNQSTGKGLNPAIDPELLNTENNGFLDFGAGLNYRYQKNARTHIDIGGGAYHINGPSDKFQNAGSYNSKRPLRLSGYAMSSFRVANRIDILLNGLYANQDVYNEIVLNGLVKIILSQNKDISIYLGGGTRIGDALYPMAAIQVGPFYGAYSYDINNSPWDIATDGRGGPEISLKYIWAKVRDVDFNPCLIF